MSLANILRRRGAGRIPLIDAMRGIAIVAMFAFHLTWDLSYFGYIDPRIVFRPAFKIFAETIGSTFLAVAGVSLVLAHAPRFRVRAYLRHLLNVGEILGLRMLSVHNTRMYLKVMEEMRAAIAGGSFAEYRREFAQNYVPTQKVLLARAAAADR